MKTVSIPVDNATWQAAEQAAESQRTTIGELVAGFVRKIAGDRQTGAITQQQDQARKELVDALRSCQAAVGETPTRDRTYSDRRFHRH